MELFAMDIGNKQVKLKSRLATKVLPSYFVEVSEYGKRGAIGVSRNNEKTTNDYKSVRDEFTYVWGPGLDVRRKIVTDTINFTNRYNSLEFKLLTDFALAELARDFKEAKKLGVIDVAVVTGVPTDDYEREGTVKQITEALKGVHAVQIDGDFYTINVVDVYVLMQTTGTALDVMVGESYTVLDSNDIEDGYIGIVDIGGGTLLIDSFEELNLDTKNRKQTKYGAHMLYTNIRNVLVEGGADVTDHEVEAILRAGNETDGYFWSPNRRTKHDVTEIVKTERNKYTRIVMREIKAAFKDIAKMRRIYITGGTANLLNKSTVAGEIPIVKFVKNSETAVVRGYYKWGVLNEVTKENVGEE